MNLILTFFGFAYFYCGIVCIWKTTLSDLGFISEWHGSIYGCGFQFFENFCYRPKKNHSMDVDFNCI